MTNRMVLHSKTASMPCWASVMEIVNFSTDVEAVVTGTFVCRMSN